MIFILLYFILGIAFIQWIFPFIEEIFSVLTAVLELFKGKISVKLAEYKFQITKMTQEENGETSSSRAIGFIVPDYEEEEDEE